MLSSFNRPAEQEQGFTLIELLVVIIIIGILAAIAIPLFLDQRKLAVDASVKADVRNTVANIQTWQANTEANRTKAEANTGAYVADGGKIAQTPGNSIGVSIDASGAATVCAYNAGGKTYLADSAAYVFNPATGQFTTGSCATGSTTGGTSGSNAGGSSTGTVIGTLDFDTTPPAALAGANNSNAGTVGTGGSISGKAYYINTPTYNVELWHYVLTTPLPSGTYTIEVPTLASVGSTSNDVNVGIYVKYSDGTQAAISPTYSVGTGTNKLTPNVYTSMVGTTATNKSVTDIIVTGRALQPSTPLYLDNIKVTQN